MKFLICALSMSIALMIAGCATVSPDAARLMTIQDGAVMAMMDCTQLGYVTGDAGIWGGTAGLDLAFTDAKNQAAKVHGSNAILVTNSRMNPTAVVNATVFNCSKKKTQKIEIVKSESGDNPTTESRTETLRKARACQQQGGVWLNDQCVLEIK